MAGAENGEKFHQREKPGMTSRASPRLPKGKQWWVAVISLALGGLLLLAYLLWSAHREVTAETRDKVEHYAQIVELRLDTTIRRIEADIAEISASMPLAALDAAAAGTYRVQIEQELERHHIAFPEVAGFRVVDAEGNMLYKAGDGVYANLADRNYFQQVRDRPDELLVFSEVLESRVTKRPTLVAARGIRDGAGKFRGMVSVPLELIYFDTLFAKIQVGVNGAVAIRRSDNHELVMRWPEVPSELNAPLQAGHPVRTRIERGETVGVLTFKAQTDGLMRTYAFRALDRYPFYVLVGLAEIDVTAVWRQRALTVGGLGLLLFAGLSLLLFRLFMAQERELLVAERFRKQQEQIREAQRIARVGSWETDLISQKTHWSEELYQLMEIDPAEVAGSYEAFMARVHPDDRLALVTACEEAVRLKQPFQIEHRLQLPDGRIKHVLHLGDTRLSPDGKPLRTIRTIQDITGVRQLEAQMQLLASAFQYSGEAILITDRENRIVTVNPSFTQLTGYTAEEAIGRDPRFLSAGRTSLRDYELMWQGINERGFWQGEIFDRRKDGGIYPKWMSISVIRDEAGEIRYHIAHFTDISAERAVEAQLAHVAHHDVLTGLLNRFSMVSQLEQALASARRDNSRLAVVFIDLDRFKVINDTLGHHVGDELLKAVAGRLRDSVRDSDVVARIGGDEFVIVLTGFDHMASVGVVAEKLVFNVGEPYCIEGHDLYTSPSIGIAIFPSDGADGETLLKNADAAMYHAKAAGRNNFQFFDPKMNDAALERLTIEHSLRLALEREEFCLHFQPIIDVLSGRVVSVEALVRWQHPERGLVPPGKFIGIAEETGLIQPLGEWVFWAACRQLAAFNAAGIHEVKMGINISSMQMRNDNLPILARGAVEALGLDPRSLIFEITESVAMQRPDDTVRILDLLHDMGIVLAIDDFGTGYSSLSYLKMFPIDHLKLDRAFVEEIGTGPDGATICDATIGLAHNLGLKVVAEGVEDEVQFEHLRERGCDSVQGYLFSRPVPADEVMAFIRQRNAIVAEAVDSPETGGIAET
jgi:diguanylate cyclase (GGDEF)-like protein/PAS domain S-box-containing protein